MADQAGKGVARDGKTAEALEIFRDLKSATSNPDILGDCGAVLLQFDQYEPARRFESAVAPLSSAAAFARPATAIFHCRREWP